MSKPPLWKVVDEAWWSLVNTAEPHCDPPASDQAACVIRALRDWLVPEEPEPRIYEHCDRDDLVAWHRWDERQDLRALLTAEAARAEQGEME